MKKIYLLLVFLIITGISFAQEYKRMINNGTYTVQEIQVAAEAHFEIVGKGRGVGYKPYKRWEYHALRNMDENGMLKSNDFYYNELERVQQEQNFNTILADYQGSWEELGPTTWNATSGWNPGVGRITSLAIEEANTNHMIVGGPSGGVWRTTDGGTTWNVLTDNLSNMDVYALAMDPTTPTTYYWGSTNGIIYRSLDSGATWNFLADVGTGTVNKILVDPNNTAKLYCSVQNGGVYKSTNSGTTWQIIHPSATNGFDVEFKPGDSNTVYATGNQFFKSTDGGVTFNVPSTLPNWTQEYVSGNLDWSTASTNENNSVTPKTGNGMAILFIDSPSNPITRLVSPSMDITDGANPQLKFSYTQVNWFGDIDELRVLYKTSAGGAWNTIATYPAEVTNWTDITLNLPNPSADYYIAFEGRNKYGRGTTLDDVVVETSTGVVFLDGFENSPNAFGSGEKMMGVSAADPNVIYVLEASSGVFGGFHRSTDGGATFTKLDHTGKNYFGYSSTASDNRGQAPRDMDVAVNPADANEVHIAGILTWRSTDGGTTFNITSQWTPGGASSQNIGYCHADVDLLQFVGSSLYVGSDGGIFVAENTGTINTTYYRDLTDGLGIRQFYRIGVSQTDPEVVTGGSQDNGSSVYDNTGAWKDWLGADGMEGFVDKNNNSVIYGTSQNGSLYKSTNGGDSSFGLPSPDDKSGNWVTPFEQDPLLVNVIYSGYDQVYKSVNGGNNWSAISQNFGGNLNHLKIAPSNSNIMFASRGSSLYKTTNGGATNWTQLSGFSGSINSIAIHPTNPNKIAIATTGAQKVYVSTNGGSTWVTYLNNLPNFSALALVWQNNADEGLYVGMNYGIYYIDNTFTEWQPFSNNLPNVRITELEINTANNKIYAATYGRGLWRSSAYDPTLSVADYEFNTITVYPNPASNAINLAWDKNEKVSVRIFDAAGKIVYYAKSVELLTPLSIDINNYASGMYFVKINNKDGFTTKRIIVE